jgi:hypothetical protein
VVLTADACPNPQLRRLRFAVSYGGVTRYQILLQGRVMIGGGSEPVGPPREVTETFIENRRVTRAEYTLGADIPEGTDPSLLRGEGRTPEEKRCVLLALLGLGHELPVLKALPCRLQTFYLVLRYWHVTGRALRWPVPPHAVSAVVAGVIRALYQGEDAPWPAPTDLPHPTMQVWSTDLPRVLT